MPQRTPVPLCPGVSPPQLFRGNNKSTREADRIFATLRPAVLARANFTCQGCGLQMPQSPSLPSGGLEVHHKNYNHRDNTMENLVALCPFCHGIFHLGIFGRRFEKSMQLIYCPWIAQKDLNLLSWGLAILLFDLKTTRNPALATLKARATWLCARLANHTSFPNGLMQNLLKDEEDAANKGLLFFAHMLEELRVKDPNLYRQRARLLSSVRIFYDARHYEEFSAHNKINLIEHLLQTPFWMEQRNWPVSLAELAKKAPLL